MEEEFRISKNLLKTITVDTRVQILKSLENRPMTASELSRFLNKHVTTITEHLELLKSSNLIERIERPGRKWIYYKLTREGKKVLHPESYRWIMVFSTTFIVLVSSWYFWAVDAYPGQLLYPLERGREALQLALAPNELEKAKKHLEFAEERLKEAKFAAEKQDENLVKNMVNEYQKEIEKAKLQAETARKKRINIIPFLETLSEASPKHTLILGNLITKIPEVKKEIQPVVNSSIENYKEAIGELKNITGKPYAAEIAIRPL